MTKPALLLNADGAPLQYFPLSLVNWKVAIKLVYLEHVVVIAEHEDCCVHSPSLTMQVPSIIMLKSYHKVAHTVQLSRTNIFLRDGNTCQYCGQVFERRALTLDHVKPKSKGGENSWENLVTACSPCNTSKGSDYIRPLNSPILPTIREMVRQYNKHHRMNWTAEWEHYLKVK